MRRVRDLALLETLWDRLTAGKCALCRDGKPGPRCAACLLRGTA
jgi:hypothetical protein